MKAEAAAKAPSISQADLDRGVAEGNIYVVYSSVMCFAGTLDTPEDFKKSPHSAEEIAEFEANYAAIPQVVLDQSQLNSEGRYPQTPPQGCYDAGWVNPGSA